MTVTSNNTLQTMQIQQSENILLHIQRLDSAFNIDVSKYRFPRPLQHQLLELTTIFLLLISGGRKRCCVFNRMKNIREHQFQQRETDVANISFSLLKLMFTTRFLLKWTTRLDRELFCERIEIGILDTPPAVLVRNLLKLHKLLILLLLIMQKISLKLRNNLFHKYISLVFVYLF